MKATIIVFFVGAILFAAHATNGNSLANSLSKSMVIYKSR